PPQAPPGKAPLQGPAGEKAAAKGAAKAPERPAAKKPAEVRPEAKKAVADAKPAHVDRPVKEHPAAAAAPPAAQAAATAPAAPAAPQPLRYLELDGPIQVGDLAGRMGVPAGEVVKRLVEAGVMAGINHMIPLEIAGRVMAAFNFAPRAPERVEVTELAPTLE